MKIFLFILSLLIISSAFLTSAADAFWRKGLVIEYKYITDIAHDHDDEDRPHILFHDCIDEVIIYAFWNDTEWQFTTIAGGHYFRECRMVLDMEDNPHISWHDNDEESLRYAVLENGEWNIETVDSGGESGYYSALDVDYRNRPGIVYYKNDQTEMKFARKSDDGWNIETVYVDSRKGYHCNLAFDGEGYPCICYMKGPPAGTFRFVRKTVNGWEFKAIEISSTYGVIGIRNSIKIDSKGNPHIAAVWYDREVIWGHHFFPMVLYYYKLYYYHWNGTAWTKDIFLHDDCSYGCNPIYCSIAIDNFDRPHLFFELDGFMHAVKEDNEWTVHEIPYTGKLFSRSLSLNSSGHPSIAYDLSSDINLLWEFSPVWYDLLLHDRSLERGDRFLLERRIKNRSGERISVTEYLALDFYGELFFYPEWTTEVSGREWTIENEEFKGRTILDFCWTSDMGRVRNAGFWGMLTDTETSEVVTIDRVDWQSLE